MIYIRNWGNVTQDQPGLDVQSPYSARAGRTRRFNTLCGARMGAGPIPTTDAGNGLIQRQGRVAGSCGNLKIRHPWQRAGGEIRDAIRALETNERTKINDRTKYDAFCASRNWWSSARTLTAL